MKWKIAIHTILLSSFRHCIAFILYAIHHSLLPIRLIHTFCLVCALCSEVHIYLLSWMLSILFGLFCFLHVIMQCTVWTVRTFLGKLKTINWKWNTCIDITMHYARHVIARYGVFVCICQRTHNLISLTESNNCKLFKVFESLFVMCYVHFVTSRIPIFFYRRHWIVFSV